MTDPHAPGACANCGTPLGGPFCSQCGQSAHDPNTSFLHALEEVVESFWHLDGRVFRTLRALLVPGRPATDYLAGHRVPYVAPMRLFVVLSVLTFFVARLALHAGSPPVPDTATPVSQPATARVKDGLEARFAALDDPAQVRALRESSRQDLAHAMDDLPEGIGKQLGQGGMQVAIDHVDQLADARLAQLGEPGPAPSRPEAPAEAAQDAPPGQQQVRIAGLPAFANAWLTTQLAHIRANLPRLQRDPMLLFNAFFASVPSALFVLVPLFALLLRLCYLGSGRGYLHHLVVALYSHAFLLVDLLAVVLLGLAKGLLLAHAPVVSGALGWVQLLLVLWMPVSLWLAQKRVYGQGWLATSLRYLGLGTVYGVLVLLASLWLMLLSLAHL